MHKAVLKGSRWLLLKAPENLKSHRDPKKDERIRLQAALELNQPLAMAYYMKKRLNRTRRNSGDCTDLPYGPLLF
ncbi:MAG: transposase [Planctomycetota bacterium]